MEREKKNTRYSEKAQQRKERYLIIDCWHTNMHTQGNTDTHEQGIQSLFQCPLKRRHSHSDLWQSFKIK